VSVVRRPHLAALDMRHARDRLVVLALLVAPVTAMSAQTPAVEVNCRDLSTRVHLAAPDSLGHLTSDLVDRCPSEAAVAIPALWRDLVVGDARTAVLAGLGPRARSDEIALAMRQVFQDRRRGLQERLHAAAGMVSQLAPDRFIEIRPVSDSMTERIMGPYQVLLGGFSRPVVSPELNNLSRAVGDQLHETLRAEEANDPVAANRKVWHGVVMLSTVLRESRDRPAAPDPSREPGLERSTHHR